jgi:hypothetical protein
MSIAGYSQHPVDIHVDCRENTALKADIAKGGGGGGRGGDADLESLRK